MVGKNIKKNANLNYLSILKRGETIRIPLEEVIYIESNARKLIVHTAEEIFEYNDKIGNLAEVLEPEGFIRCHQSYLVNLSAISSIRYDELIVNGKAIRISRKYRDDVKKAVGILQNKSKGSVAGNRNDSIGIIKCVLGPYAGKQWNIHTDKELIVGRSGDLADIVINLPTISRKHFSVVYHYDKKVYEVMDMSANGTFVEDDIRLEKGQHYEIGCGEKLILGDNVIVLKLV